MEILWRGDFIGRSVCDEILDILKKPKDGPINSGLPAGTEVASKPGGLPGVRTEWAIVLLKDRPYVMTIMENYGLGQDASETLANLSKTAHSYFNRLKLATPFGSYVTPPTPEPM